MKASLSYKSKRNIVISAIIVVLAAAIGTGTYFFTKGNSDQAEAFSDNGMQVGETSQTETQGNQGDETVNPEGNQGEVIEPNLEQNQEGTSEEDNNGETVENGDETTSSSTGTTTGNNGSTTNNGTTGTTTGDVPNQDYVTERIETEEVLVSEDYEVAWSPLTIRATTTTSELGIVRPIIVAEKSTENKEVVAGEEIEYTITVSNIGNLEGTAIVQDKAPEKTTFKPDSIKINNVEAKHEDGTSFTEAELEEGIELSIKPEKVVTVSFIVIVNEKETITESDENIEIQTAGTIINTAIVNGEETNPVKTPILHTEKKSEVYRSDEKVDVAKVGDTIKYIITVTNTSEEQLDIKTNIIDKAPDGTTLVEESISEGGVIANDGTISWDEITLAKGEEKEVSFSVVVNEARTGIIKNTAVVADMPTNEIENPVIDVEIDKSVYNLNNGAEVGKNTSVTVNKDDVIGYKIIVKNTGDVTLTDVKVTDTRKVYLDYESAREGKAEGSNIVAKGVTLTSGETKEYIVYYKVTANDMKDSTVKLENIAKVEGNYEEDEEIVEKIEHEDEEEVNIAKVPGITAVKERVGTGKVEPGDTITYKITVTNIGNTKLTDVKLFDTMNGSSREITITELIVAGSKKTIPAKVNGAYNIGNLGIGQKAVITATYKVIENDMAETEQTITNTAKAEGLSDGDVKVESDEGKVDVKTKVWKTVIELEKSSTLIKANPTSLVGSTTAEYGDTIKYTIKATNKGRKAGTVVVKDYIPEGVELVEYNESNGTTNLTQAEYNELKSATTGSKFSKTLSVEGNDGANNGITSIYFTVKVTAKPGETIQNIATDGRDNSNVSEPGNRVEKVVSITTKDTVPVIENSNVVIVLDISKSMDDEKFGNETRLAVAKRTVKNLLDKISLNDDGTGSAISIVTFWGHRTDVVSGRGYSTTLTCGGTDTIANTPTEKAALKTTVDGLSKQWGTVISGALLRTGDAVDSLIAANSQNKNIVIFIGDGEPVEDGEESSIVTYANNIKNKVNANGVKTNIYSIGFGVNLPILQSIASKPTQYASVTDVNSLNLVFTNIVEEESLGSAVPTASNQGLVALPGINTNKKVTINGTEKTIAEWGDKIKVVGTTYHVNLKKFDANANVTIVYYTN